MYDIHSSILENFMDGTGIARVGGFFCASYRQYCDEAGCTRTTSALVLS